MEYNTNTKTYWGNRFENNWETLAGREQTIFFANILCEHLPEWFVNKIREKKYNICDVGCALGDAVEIFTEFFKTNVEGIDFSEVAVQKASEKYTKNIFHQIDITNIPEFVSYDVLICSNVLEHFNDPWEIVKKFNNVAAKYAILLVPFQEILSIDEHVYKFDNSKIPLQIEDFTLLFSSIIDASIYSPTYYGGLQLLLIYSKEHQLEKQNNLADICNFSFNLNIRLNEVIEENRELKLENSKQLARIDNLSNSLEYTEENLNVLKSNYELLNKKINVKNGLIDNLNQELLKVKNYMNDYNYIQNELAVAKNIIYNYQIDLMKLQDSFSWKITSPVRKISKILGISSLHQKIKNSKQLEKEHVQLKLWLYHITKNSSFAPLIKKIVPKRIRTNVSREYYNNQIGTKLNPCTDILVELETFISNLDSEQQVLFVISGVKYVDSEGQRNIRLVHEAVKKDIKVIFAYWRWDKNEIIDKSDSMIFKIPLDVVYESRIILFEKILQGLSKKALLIEFPHKFAIEIAEIANCFGWTTIYDVIDDWEEFSKCGQAIWFDKKTELRLANIVDINIATAARLKEKISQYLNNDEHYYLISNGVDPSRIKCSDKIAEYNFNRGNLQIGYFGHLTDAWFDWRLIKKIAVKNSDWTFHIIGYGQPEDLNLPKNIILYGKKEPNELAKYAAYWDLAIIPFVNNELTLSVNPIKIYEYLQLQLPVVATNMPEIEHFPYTKTTTNDEEFEAAILKMKNCIVDKKIVDAFISENTWERKLDQLMNCVASFDSKKTYKLIYKI